MPPKGKGRGRGQAQQRQEQPPPGGAPPQQQPQRPQQPPQQQQQQQQSPQQQPQRPPQQQPPHEQGQAPPQQQQQQRREKPKFSPISVDDLAIEVKRRVLIEPDMPRDPGPGRMGRRIKLVANCYPLKLPEGHVYHYDVEVNNVRQGPQAEKSASKETAKQDKRLYKCINTKRNREVVAHMINTSRIFKGKPAVYDGRKNLYTRKPLDIQGKTRIEVELPDEYPGDPNDPRGPRKDNFEVTLQPVCKKDTSSCAISLESLHAVFEGKVSEFSQEAVMVIETVLRNSPCMKFTPIGRSFFYKPSQEDLHPLGGGKEIWFGYHQSLRLGQRWPMVNLDITATTFYHSGPVLEYIADFLRLRDVGELRNRRLTDADRNKITKELKVLKVETTHLRAYKRKYKVLGLTKESADKLSFENTDRTTNVTTRTTVQQYFLTQYNMRLQFPHLPCIQGNPKEKKIYLPLEVCNIIEGQHCKKKLEDRQNAEMIKFTARAPDRRFKEISDIRRKTNFESDAFLREFGITVQREPMSLEGRVIEPPSVQYMNEKRIKPRDGSWDMRNNSYYRPAVINCWAMLSWSNTRFCNEGNLERFAKMLCDIAREQGMTIQRPIHIGAVNFRTQPQQILDDMKRKGAEFVVCVLPSANKTIYGELKQAAELVLGLKTQCVKDDNVVKKCNPPLVSNLCQKINAKMGGINNSLSKSEVPDVLKKPVIIIGADVTHPGPSQDIKPSIAAAVGSLDAHPSRYAVTIRAQVNQNDQKQAIEYILDLKSMVVDLLKAFYRATKGKKPEKIIFYRDGVSEGMFGEVQHHEIKAIREACKVLQADYQPLITFIIVQKRHHTRFMTQDPRDGVGKMKNIPPGTAVDTAVTHPLNFDFFLCSHFGLQGTSRPGHYTVLQDDTKFSQDDLQKLTYYLCHTYARCTKSISIPCPVAYAHLAAYRARQHLLTQYDESSNSSDSTIRSGRGDIADMLPQIVHEAIKIRDDMKETMYFV